ncbi:MAG: hypothetical protein J7M40_10025 [Planctomycetes bacterium]|nr:hypothetical protein [Planctomycetota bacterium]
MFNNLLGFWRGKDFLTQVLGQFKEMLEGTETMFKLVCDTLFNHVENPALKDQIYEIDKRVNGLQKDIRKRIVEHLTLQPTLETSLCLLLMSVVKDAERLGDYAKNLYEVTGLLDEPINRELFAKYFNHLEDEVKELFTNTKEAFMESDNARAISSWDVETTMAKKLDETIEVIAASDLTVNQAVCYTLIARHFKRIMAHLVNIATSVVLPISDLDYYDEKTAEG